ncbi:MAG: type II secretion system protein [Patescibacteria group bacterium]|nr:type II secretion system protein [Patescibacteria group bacterium]
MKTRQFSQRGFTLVETLVAISVLVMLSGVMVVYNRSSEQEIVMLREQAKLISFVSRAKSFALQTYLSGTPACGYGIHVDQAQNSVILFRDLAAKCPGDNKYTDSSELVDSYQLPATVHIASASLTDVLFVPPDPDVIFTPSQNQGTVTLQTLSGGMETSITISNAGQITTR